MAARCLPTLAVLGCVVMVSAFDDCSVQLQSKITTNIEIDEIDPDAAPMQQEEKATPELALEQEAPAAQSPTKEKEENSSVAEMAAGSSSLLEVFESISIAPEERRRLSRHEAWSRLPIHQQIATVLFICVVVVNLVSWLVARKNPGTDTNLDASTRLERMLKALRFEPTEKSLPIELKSVTELDSGNNSEDEPEHEEKYEAAGGVAAAIARRWMPLRSQLIMESENQEVEVEQPIELKSESEPTVTDEISLKEKAVPLLEVERDVEDQAEPEEESGPDAEREYEEDIPAC